MMDSTDFILMKYPVYLRKSIAGLALAVSRGKVTMSAIQAAVPAVSSWAPRLGGA